MEKKVERELSCGVWSGRGHVVWSADGGLGGWKALDADSGQRFNPLEWLTLLPLRCGPSEGGGLRRTERGLFLALHLHPLPVGGCVNNMATGKINCGQAAGLRGSLWEQREHWVGKACDLWGWEEISQGRLELPFNSVPKEMKALCKEDIEISRQKIVDILEGLILLITIVFRSFDKKTKKN